MAGFANVDEEELSGHPVRAALLALLAERGTLTSTEAARELGESSGLCSFHLRQLAKHGYLEEVAGARGRVRPWRLRERAAVAAEQFDRLARELEDEGFRRWQQGRANAPEQWRQDEAFSAVLHLSPDQLPQVAAEIRAVLARYASPRPGTGPVAGVVRLFPLLPVPLPLENEKPCP
ncbi:winged helix-turn-helix domain-containing protein [Kutzneria albida]|uniref:winged helix-turn-helix domain-containing protein n=1 Tax=Kutzneria albida TaxID=43357 RepID=UPI0005AA4466|nr:winged helix-turn-helix domain-containing protein [Kutzneria albida]